MPADTLERYACEWRARAKLLDKSPTALRRLQEIVDAERLNSAIQELLHICVEYREDYGCGLRLSVLSDSLGYLVTPLDSVAAAETALLSDDLVRADQWLVPLSRERLAANPCAEMVASFYKIWLLSAQGRGADLAPEFGNWAAAVRNYPWTEMGSCWMFSGTRRVLERRTDMPARDLLLGMIAPMEESNAPLPIILH